ncbi:extracellular solute-binding protein [Scatolibacter rhodanostii]|uniref:extracellular solute-binding protein n=1 Tax=Scatolibacter rhodanostii TaxID=2014781 RepID=UPI00190EDC76|nr:extracellular solute-binding protein [Scatolibacter rhodanostii]
MKNVKKLAALSLSLVMLFSSLAGCGDGKGKESTASKAEESKVSSKVEESKSEVSTSKTEETSSGDDLAFKKFDEPVDVHIGMSVSPIDTTLPAGDSAQDNQYTRYLRDNYNINVIVDWTAAEGNDYNQKVSLAIASDTLPDGLVANEQSYLRKAAKSNMLMDITDLFDQYASEQVKGIVDSTDGRAIESVSFDGKMQGLPNVTVDTDGVHILNIRKDWLDEYSLEVPKTLDDVENIAKVFKEKKPAGDQTIPLSGPDKNERLYCTFLESSNNAHGLDPVFSAYDVYPGYWLQDDKGEVVYGSTDEKMKPALERLAKWYAEGYIDPEMGTRDSSGEAVNANQVGMFFGPWWSLGYGNGDSFKNDPTANWQTYPIFSDDGKWNVHMKSVGTSSTMISKNASEDVAAAIIIMYNALVRDEGVFDTSVAIGWYPLRTVAAAADEVEHESQELTRVLNGEADPEEFNDPMSIYKLLYQDATKVRNVVTGYTKDRELAVTDFSMENEGDFKRMYAILIGNRPYATTEVDKKVYSLTYSMTETMERKWANLKKLEDETMLKIITGQEDISAFDTFVSNWHAQGGDEILAEVAGLN